MLLLQKYNICSFENKWTCRLHLPRRYILYTFWCVFSLWISICFSLPLVLFFFSCVIIVCPDIFHTSLFSQSKAPMSWILVRKASVSLGFWKLGNIRAVLCWVTGFLELSSFLPVFYIVALFSFDRWVSSLVLAKILSF